MAKRRLACLVRPSVDDASEWDTPMTLFLLLDDEFHFTLDVCAQPWNNKVASYYTPEQDGIEQPWGDEVCWMNPPARDWDTWLAKAWGAAQCGATVVGLLPVRTDTEWWQEFVLGEDTGLGAGADEIRFIRGQLEDAPGRHAWAIVVFRPRKPGDRRQPRVCGLDLSDPEPPKWLIGPVIEGEVIR